MKKIGIYKILNIVNNKIYIGSSGDIMQRIRLHRSQLKRGIHGNSYLQNSWNKYGSKSFRFSIVEECEKTFLIERESFYINLFSALDRNKGYNVASNIHDTSGYKWSEASRLKLSMSKKGTKMHKNTLKALIEANKKRVYKTGFNQKRESVEKSAESRKVKILQYSINGIFIREWKSAEDAGISLNLLPSGIRNCCVGRRYIVGNFQWMDKPLNGVFPKEIPAYKRCSKLKSINIFKRLCSEMSIEKQGELLGNPEMDNQQPSLSSNVLEGSTTNSRVLTSNVEDSNADTSALPIRNNGDDIV